MLSVMCRGNDRPLINLSNDDVGLVIAFAGAFSFGAVAVIAATIEALMGHVISASRVGWREDSLLFYT